MTISPGTATTDAARGRANKVAAITVVFWAIKILTTGLGETGSDFLVTHFDPVVAVGVSTLVLAVVLLLQVRAPRFVPALYWSAVVMVAVVGTMVADVVHVALGVPYSVSTPVFVVLLAVVFGLWFRTEKTLSIHTVTTRRRELFYWATVMATFALGTAAGDWTAKSLGLGYLLSGVMFTLVIAVPAVLHLRWRLNPVVAFWFAYIVTRPLGASFADWLAVTPARGGLDLGAGPVTLGLAAIMVGCLVAVTLLRRGRRLAGPVALV